MKRVMSTSLILALFFSSGVAFAQNNNIREFTFEEDQIEGELLSPQGAVIASHTSDDLICLIKVREDFNDKTRRTIDDL